MMPNKYWSVPSTYRYPTVDFGRLSPLLALDKVLICTFTMNRWFIVTVQIDLEANKIRMIIGHLDHWRIIGGQTCCLFLFVSENYSKFSAHSPSA